MMGNYRIELFEDNIDGPSFWIDEYHNYEHSFVEEMLTNRYMPDCNWNMGIIWIEVAPNKWDAMAYYQRQPDKTAIKVHELDYSSY